jgi:hypothetical protein
MSEEQLLKAISQAINEVLAEKEEEDIEERTKRDTPDRVAGRDTGGRRVKQLEEVEDEEGEKKLPWEKEDKEEAADQGPEALEEEETQPDNDEWYQDNLYERLVRKWTKQ